MIPALPPAPPPPISCRRRGVQMPGRPSRPSLPPAWGAWGSGGLLNPTSACTWMPRGQGLAELMSRLLSSRCVCAACAEVDFWAQTLFQTRCMWALMSSRCVCAACAEVDFGLNSSFNLDACECYRQAGASLLLVLKQHFGLECCRFNLNAREC